MPLSEQEQRLLDEMERHLLRNDADVVSADRDGRAVNYRNVTIGVLIALVGIGGLIAGVATQLIVIGVIGFVAMLGGVVLAATPMKVLSPRVGSTPKSAGSGAPKAASSFMDRMSDRWDRRQGGDR
ncbi:DUF3040 domain-containing protein [Microbacterium sp. LRZ72]|uniref:DUF3040 domain-containing protein n=1 Tax=Microbacterium sp. LRZ72 TaxID=2942481 RepID=UPI0029A37F4F|nr:DUF3040 domain-containing protein [Microbacterium sp. LRZ72]MDX2377163.1 DUF3040 domain-containing protein [Microbacterium sp. LRZ72]